MSNFTSTETSVPTAKVWQSSYGAVQLPLSSSGTRFGSECSTGRSVSTAKSTAVLDRKYLSHTFHLRNIEHKNLFHVFATVSCFISYNFRRKNTIAFMGENIEKEKRHGCFQLEKCRVFYKLHKMNKEWFLRGSGVKWHFKFFIFHIRCCCCSHQ